MVKRGCNAKDCKFEKGVRVCHGFVLPQISSCYKAGFSKSKNAFIKLFGDVCSSLAKRSWIEPSQEELKKDFEAQQMCFNAFVDKFSEKQKYSTRTGQRIASEYALDICMR